MRADPDTLGSNRTSASDTGSRPKSQLGPTQPNPSQIRPTQPNPGPQRSPRRGPNRDLSTLTLPNGPNLTQRSGKLLRQQNWIWGVGEVRSLALPAKEKQLDNFITRQIYLPHVLVHFLKSTKAYNVKSSSTLFLDNILSNFEISFPCVRFNSLLGNNLIRKSWDHQKLDFHTPISRDWKNTLSCEIYVFEKLWIANLLNSKPIKMDEKIKHLYLQTF